MTRSTPKSEADREAAELAALERALVASEGAFSIGIAVCNNVPLRNHLIEKIGAGRPGIEVLSLPEGVVDVYGWVVSRVADRRPPALFLVDLDRSIRSDDKVQRALASLNASRDLWPRRFSCPAVFWLPEYAAALLSAHARDFWSRKSHQFHFAAEPMAVAGGGLPQVGGDADWALNLDADRKQFRLAELEQRIAEAGDPPRPDMVRHVLSWLNEAGAILWATGKVAEAVGFFGRLLTLAERVKDKSCVGMAFGNLGLAYAALGETRRAIEYYEKALIIDREIGDRRGEGNALGNLGLAYADLGETRSAIEYYEKALIIDREIGDRRGEGNALGNLGTAYAALGETRRAIEYYEKRLTIAREIGDRRGEGNTLWNMALALGKLGDRLAAMARARETLAIFEAIEDPNAAMVRRTLQEWEGRGQGRH